MFETLESRRMLSATLNPFTGRLEITGTSSADQISVEISPTNYKKIVVRETGGATRTTEFSRFGPDGRPLVRSISVSTGSGNDRVTIVNGLPNCTIDLGAGSDTCWAGSGNDTIYGGSDVSQQFVPLDLPDEIHAGGGNDIVYGGLGGDTIYGDGGNDVLYGESHADSLIGGAGSDRMYGGAGDDLLDARDGSWNDFVDGGTGRDTARMDPDDAYALGTIELWL